MTEVLISEATISYKALLIKIGAPKSLAESIGNYLGEDAEWCDERGMPPVNALAINASFGMPGPGYFTAAGATEKPRSGIAMSGNASPSEGIQPGWGRDFVYASLPVTLLPQEAN